MSSDPRKPTRRTMLTASAVLLAAAGPPIGAQAGAAEGRPVTPSLAAMHRRWAALKAEYTDIETEVDSIMMKNARRTWPFVSTDEGCVFSEAQIDAILDRRPILSSARHQAHIEQQRRLYKAALVANQADFVATADRLGLAPAVQRYNEIPPLIENLLDEIYAAPIETVGDVAAILDVAMGEGEIDITAMLSTKTPHPGSYSRRDCCES